MINYEIKLLSISGENLHAEDEMTIQIQVNG